MLTRVRIEVYGEDAEEAEAELDRYEVALLRELLFDVAEDIAVVPEHSAYDARRAELAKLVERMNLDFADHRGGPAELRKVTEQSIRAEEGSGYQGRRVVIYDGGAFEAD